MEDRPQINGIHQPNTPVLRMTSSVKLRPLGPDDAGRIQSLLEQLATLHATNLPEMIHPEAGSNYVRMAAGGWALTQWAPMVIDSEGQFAGLIVLEPDALCEPGEWVMFYYLLPEQWGKGIATAAVNLMLNLAFQCIGLAGVCARCLSHHAPSRRVLEKNGFRPAGQMRNEGRFGTRTAGLDIEIWKIRPPASISAPSTP